jgi:4-aminobutyrate aminotransferase/(S)-3-amino-2-methylpropionate transaminase
LTEVLIERRMRHVPRGVGNAHQLFVSRAQGALVWDVDGREYYDFIGGIGVLNVGHSHPKVVAAVAAQAQLLTHTCFQVAMYEPYVALAEALNELAPGPSPKKTLLLTTGSEATENAVKIAREYTRRPAVVAFQNGYHGRTLLALSMTGKNAPYKQHFGPFCPEVYHSVYPHELRGWSTKRALESLRELFATQVAPDRVAAIIIEPVLGEGGFIAAPLDFLLSLRAIADEFGIVLIADEIQSGFGRTGRYFAIEHAGIEADLITVAKSMAGGLPLSAVIGKAEIMDAPSAGGLGGTYAGNPISCAAALAVLEIFKEERLLERSDAIGARIRKELHALAKRFPSVVEIRGIGAMVGVEFARHADGTSYAERIITAARERGLLLLLAGRGDAIRFLVPLVITDDQLNEALARFTESCVHVLAER